MKWRTKDNKRKGYIMEGSSFVKGWICWVFEKRDGEDGDEYLGEIQLLNPKDRNLVQLQIKEFLERKFNQEIIIEEGGEL